MASITRTDNKDKISFYIRTNLTNEKTNKKIRKTMTWTAPNGMSEAEAKKAVIEVANEFEKKLKEEAFLGIEDVDFTIEQYSKVYLDYIKNSYSPSYYARALQIFEYINSKIGHLKLKNLTPSIIQGYFDDVDKEKRIEIITKPVKNFKEVLAYYGYTYKVLRYETKIQHATLSRAVAGHNVEKEWADRLCDKTRIPFNKLFIMERSISDYSYRTKQQWKTLVRQMLAFAKRQQVVKENYATADFVFYTRNKTIHQIEAMDEDQAKKFFNTLNECEDIRIKTSLLLFLLTGFRRSEVAALKWSDIDLEKHKITINRSAVEDAEGNIVFKNPKTVKSQRTITVSNILINQLELYKEWQKELINQSGDYYQDEDFLFTRDNGHILALDTFRFWLHKILDKAELPHFTIHSLRHTNITLQILSGVPLVTVAGRAGHSRTSTTSDVYSHYLQSSDTTAAEKIANIFDSKEENSMNDIIELKKEAKENGFTSLKEYIEFLRQSLK